MDRVLDQVKHDVEILKGAVSPLPGPVAKPYVILVSGLPGTGKSYVSARLAERLPLVILETDELRKRLFPIPLYALEESSRLFQACHILIEELLSKGIPMLLDATNLVERNREYVYSIADRLRAKLVIVRVTAPPEEVRRRLQKRSNGAREVGHSDADWEVYRRMQASEEAIRRNHLVVDTSKDITPVLDKVVRDISNWLKV